MSILACGPFIGDFEQEIVCFRPYMKYVFDMFNYEKVYVSSHFNRKFLYEWCEDDNFIPIYEHLTREEEKQRGYVNDEISFKDYSLLLKVFKTEILKREDCTIRNLDVNYISYTKSIIPYSVYQKSYTPIKVPNIDIDIEEKDFIVFIPDVSSNERYLLNLYNKLRKHYNIIIVGDQKTYLSNENVILKRIDYFENCYSLILKYMSLAKLIICPNSFWTFLCNLQQWPVLSWGETPGLYKSNGIYGFQNQKCVSTPINNMGKLIELIEYTLNK